MRAGDTEVWSGNRVTVRTTVKQAMRWAMVGIAAMVMIGCATGRSVSRGDDAARRGDWDAAVAYYREAVASSPDRVENRIALERAMREAASLHMARAKKLEEEDQLSGAAAEYRLAVEFDPSNVVALSRALAIERRIRDLAEASRPRSRMDELRQQAQQQSPIPTLDPRTPLPGLTFTNTALRDIFTAISVSTGINITYDQGLDGPLQRPHTINVQNMPLEQVLNQLMTTFALTFKVIDPKTIFIYADNQGNRQKYEDLYQQTFYVSHADATEVSQILNQMLTTTTGGGNRPVVTLHKTLNAINVRASAPMMGLIKNIIDTADKPRAEVLIDVSILEVSRQRLKNLGIDLSAYAIGLAFSPEVAPSATTANTLPAPPVQPPPISAGSFSGATRNDVYVSVPTAIIRLLESDQKTRQLAKPQLRGREGATLTLNLGDEIPVPTTSILPIATGGIPTQPQVQFQYRPVGVNLSMMPRVTFQDEIVLDPITIDKSSRGPDIEVSGALLPTFISRRASVTMRLRDGESNILAGLIRDDERETARSLPGINRIPILRSLFGNTETVNEESDLIMIVTPHIIRGRDITAADLAPFYVGTSNNLGAGNAPTLISPNAPPPPTIPPPGGGGATPPPAGGAQPPTAGQPPTTNPAGQTSATNPRAANIVPIEQVGAQPPAPTGAVLAAIVPEAPMQMGGAPYTVPLSIQGASQLGSVTVSVTYDPKVVRATAVSQGTFLQQGGIQTVFAPKIDEQAGRIDFVITRPGSSPGAAGAGPLASLSFQGIAAGSARLTITATGLTPSGQPVTVTASPATLIVK